MKRKNIAGGIAAVIALATIWFFRPWWHDVFYAMTVESPGSVQWLVVGALVFAAGAVVEGENRAKTLATLGLIIAVVGFFLAGPVIGGVYSAEHLANEGQNANQIDALPETVARRVARSAR